MLCNVNFKPPNPVFTAIAEVNGNNTDIKNIQQGVYEIGHFNMNHVVHEDLMTEYPALTDFSCIGVCDDYQQVIDQCKDLDSEDRFFVISITPIEKKNQAPEGGWRWHKWGSYIGNQEPTCEYLYDEPNIDKVCCYHIYELNPSSNFVEETQ